MSNCDLAKLPLVHGLQREDRPAGNSPAPIIRPRRPRHFAPQSLHRPAFFCGQTETDDRALGIQAAEKTDRGV
jgi:hypothetical protein